MLTLITPKFYLFSYLDCDDSDFYDIAFGCCGDYANCADAKTYCTNHGDYQAYFENNFKLCTEMSECQPKEWFCNVDKDCSDGSDEGPHCGQ